MCLSSGGGGAPAPAPRPAGAGYTVADVDTTDSKYTKVYDENQQDITSEVEKTSDNKYKKKTSSGTSPDLQIAS